MSLWLVRAGRYGEQEEGALRHGVVTIGWNDLPDLSSVASKEELKGLYENAYPGGTKRKIANVVGQIWAFVKRIQPSDLVVLPLKLRAAIAVGQVTGAYQYRTDLSPDILHVRPVEWAKTDLPRTRFDQDLLYSLGSLETVCRIERNSAEERVRKILAGEIEEPGMSDTGEETPDLEQLARDQILRHLKRKFKGHDLARLVEAVLQAQGYVTRRSEPGPDGGVDILAGAGPMGFESPRLGVQVKSSESPVDVVVLRSLQGSMATFGADQGLLVSWGGFTSAVLGEARRSFFTVRLWDSGDLIEACLKNFERLSSDIQAELPLKKIWALVPEEEVE